MKTVFIPVILLMVAILPTLARGVLRSWQCPYYVGVGRSDITGPAAEVNMMGYGKDDQTVQGIHSRQYSRAFIFADAQKRKRVVFVSMDIGMASQAIKIQVSKKLQEQFGGLYTNDNVILSGTHTHSGPGGYFQYTLFTITSKGFIRKTFDAIVEGVVKSIAQAHHKLQCGKLLYNYGEVDGAGINRSPSSYLRNPAAERDKYSGNTDKEMVVLKITDHKDKGLGMISWFPVHGTSMNNSNTLISGDNKGRASYLMENAMNVGSLPGQGSFVAAFAQSNEGDVSPNTRGPHCTDTGLPCDTPGNTCGGNFKLCVSSGPGKDMFESTDIIGTKQFNKGKELYNTARNGIIGAVDFRHTFVDMSNYIVDVKGTKVHTCPPALGFAFAAGTTDGPGAFDYNQGTPAAKGFWKFVQFFINKFSLGQKECHKPKPILLDTGGKLLQSLHFHPTIVPLQIISIGQFIILAVPGEFTTMAGRRLRETVYNALTANGYSSYIKVVIAGLSNTYSHYITTFEEYQEQRYEGASTIYGPYTLMAYQQEFTKMAIAMAKNIAVSPGPSPPDYISGLSNFLPKILLDSAPIFQKIGDVYLNPRPHYKKGDTVTATFWAGHPRNNVMAGRSFLYVELQIGINWKIICTDACWETKFKWIRTNVVLGHSHAIITWTIPSTATSGVYRIRHFGTYKVSLFTNEVRPYSGISRTFRVT